MFDTKFDQYFKNGVMLLKVRYFDETLVEDNIIEVPFSILKKYLTIELARYVKNYSVESSIRKVIYNICSTK